jgi:hypothetical protein
MRTKSKTTESVFRDFVYKFEVTFKVLTSCIKSKERNLFDKKLLLYWSRNFGKVENALNSNINKIIKTSRIKMIESRNLGFRLLRIFLWCENSKLLRIHSTKNSKLRILEEMKWMKTLMFFFRFDLKRRKQNLMDSEKICL